MSQDNIPEGRNITSVQRSSDQSVTVAFASCRAASAFQRAMESAHLERTGQSVTNDAPIPMILHCPKCGLQHIDEADGEETILEKMARGEARWRNEPHRSHLCLVCGHVWRPADVPTTGIAAVQTTGKADSPIATPPEAATAEAAGKAPASVPSDAVALGAARYQWMRDNGAELFYALADLEGAALDAAVDAALAAQPRSTT